MIISIFPNFIQRVMKNSEENFYHVVNGCRQCGYGGNLHRHGSYNRTIICREITAVIRVQRVICPDCRKTHAIIPSDLVPYFQHTLEAILKLLELVKVKKESYSNVINHFRKFNLSFALGHVTLYIRRFDKGFYSLCYYYRVYKNIFLPPAASEASALTVIFKLKPNIFNTDYFNKMPNYFLANSTSKN